LIEVNALPLSQTANQYCWHCQQCSAVQCASSWSFVTLWSDIKLSGELQRTTLL